MSFKGRIRRLDDKLERVKAVRGRTREWPVDPVEFCVEYLGFKPTVYQEKLLRDPAQFIVARWSRQSGKTHCVAALLLWVVSPEQRIQCSRLGPCCPPIQDHHPENYWISFKTAEIRGVEAAQDKDRVLQRKQNSSLPEQSRDNPR